MATPFADDETLDEARFAELIEWYMACAVHGISVAGSQGEFFGLDEAEHIRLLELAVQTVKKPTSRAPARCCKSFPVRPASWGP
jgi:4-hydroxy-tetrahydrodipicolinate synthase